MATLVVYTTSTGETTSQFDAEHECVWTDLTGAWVECVECGRLDQWFD